MFVRNYVRWCCRSLLAACEGGNKAHTTYDRHLQAAVSTAKVHNASLTQQSNFWANTCNTATTVHRADRCTCPLATCWI